MTGLVDNAVTPDASDGQLSVKLRVNGEQREVSLDPRTTLLDACAKSCISPARKKAAITANAAHARCTSTAAA